MEQYLIYLRKSRKDKELEAAGGEDTLYRHRHTLLQYAKAHSLHIAKIYEEVVSGESIAARPEVQKLLRDVESCDYAGVLVTEVERLARGNTKDQGIIAETFSYSGAKIITPNKTYDPSKEEDEEYFEFGLFMSRREYKTISRRIQRGRMASLEEGKYIASTAPYGYERYKLPKQKGWSLRIVPEQAEVVKLIFQLYTEGDVLENGSYTRLGCLRIAERLNGLGIAARNGAGFWSRDAVREILKNAVYAGYIRWGVRQYKKKMENGTAAFVHYQNHDAPLIEGLHDPIVSVEQWEKAQRLLKSRASAPVKSSKEITNPLASLVVCDICGKAMVRNVQRGRPRFSCTTPNCPTVSSLFDVVETGVIRILKNWVRDYTVKIEQKKNAPASDTLWQISKAEANLKKLSAQKDKLYDLLEQGVYATDIFLERSGKLAKQIEAQELALSKLQEKNQRETEFLHKKESFLPAVQKVIDTYYTLHSARDKNELLKEVIDKIVYHKTQGSRYTKSDMALYVYPKIH